MSNVIKASAVNYSQQIKNLDMNARAEEAAAKYATDYYDSQIAAHQQISFEEVSRKLEEEKVLTPEDVEFKPGLFGEEITVGMDEETYESEAATLEARLSEKRAELADVEANIQKAHEELESILNDARAEAERILAEARDQAAAEAEDIRSQAQTDGYNDGMEQARGEAEEQIAQARAEADAVKEEYRAEYEKQVEEMEPAFVELVVKYVEKLTGIYNEDKQEIILHLIDDAFKGQKGTENFIIRVSEDDYPIVAYSKETMKGYISEDSSIEIVADKMLTKSQCMIETESRIFDCSLDEQLKSLIEDIRLLAEKD
ncbi:MAG: hypothetical protein J5824_03120 [Lachnospiraceae bacterium]|nr:hypothetical protein [Lachnospiraceae bacterium]